jgi:hypothetical protein
MLEAHKTRVVHSTAVWLSPWPPNRRCGASLATCGVKESSLKSFRQNDELGSKDRQQVGRGDDHHRGRKQETFENEMR